jgi:hypothetical protein
LVLSTILNPSTMVSGKHPTKSAKRLNRGRWAGNVGGYMKSQMILLPIIVIIVSCGTVPTTATTLLEKLTETNTTSYTPTQLNTIIIENTMTPTKQKATPRQTKTSIPTDTQTILPNTRAEYDKVSGTYKLIRSDGSGCTILILLEPRMDPFDKISFELFCIRGAPSYNSGHAIDMILLSNDMAVYSPSDTCNIVFQFFPTSIIVNQIGLDFDCGFGHAVYADGVYTLTDNKPPRLGCLALNNPCKE